MTNKIQIRTVTTELLRNGPPHNQLLSPLTPYLGICGDSEAGMVMQPYEHAAFLRIMRSLRYDSAEERDRLPILREIGIALAKMLGCIPTLPGALTQESGGTDTMVHLRLVTSASELALLPFELAKTPVSATSYVDSWLLLQAGTPVCITRRARNVSADGVRWPARPRILFIAADPDDVPFDEHRAELVAAIEPFRQPGRDDPTTSADGRREQFGELLTVLKNASFSDVVEECGSTRYTHIHILAHGGEDTSADDTSYGIVLQPPEGEAEVISGDRFATALACVTSDGIHRPTVVTLASCDSANVGSVVIAGASVAHQLHQAGIPLVVASQFPLSKAGSIVVVRDFYRELLWGADPWLLLHQIRTDLYKRFIKAHDWASLVVYDALPTDLAEQREEMHYRQARLATEAALSRIDQRIADADGERDQDLRQPVEAVMSACGRFPFEGRFAMECLGLRASCRKRLAEAEFKLALAADARSSTRQSHLRQCRRYLEEALVDYHAAARGFLVNTGQPTQRIASLHWVLGQELSMSAVLGKKFERGTWEAARLSADAYLEHPEVDERAWAHGSLAELWLLRLADDSLAAADRRDVTQTAKDHAVALAKLFPSGDPFAIQSTRRQFARYKNWWGGPEFDNFLKADDVVRQEWHDKEDGIIHVAKQIYELLDRTTPYERSRMDENGSGRPRSNTQERKGTAAVVLAGKTTSNRSPSGVRPTAKKGPSPQGDTSSAKGSGDVVFEIEMLPAGHGDSLWIEYGDGKKRSRVLIDCGTKSTYPTLRKRIAELKESEREFELFVLSHIDDDHIGGAIPFFADEDLGVHFDDVWFNGWKHLKSAHLNAKGGEIFSTILVDRKLPWNLWTDRGPVVLAKGELPTTKLPGGLQLTLLSPSAEKLSTLADKWKKEIEALGLDVGKPADFRQFLGATPSKSTDVDKLAAETFKPDGAAPNGSSIALLAEYKGKRALFGADAHAPLLAESIRKLLKQRGEKKLKLDAFKISHHASQNNLSNELMELLDCPNYLVSTNGAHFNHPDRQAIARVIRHGGKKPRLYFNFTTKLNNVWARPDLQDKYGYTAVYPSQGKEGITVRL